MRAGLPGSGAPARRHHDFGGEVWTSTISAIRGGDGVPLLKDNGVGCWQGGCAGSGRLGRDGVLSCPDLVLEKLGVRSQQGNCLQPMFLRALEPAPRSGWILRLVKAFKREASAALWCDVAAVLFLNLRRVCWWWRSFDVQRSLLRRRRPMISFAYVLLY